MNRCCLFLVLLLSCTKQAYDGAKLPKTERARFEKAIAYSPKVSIDGAQLPKSFWGRWAIQPGVHTVSGEFNVVEYGLIPVSIPFEAEPGHNYILTFIPFFTIPVVRDLSADICWTTTEGQAAAIERYTKSGGDKPAPTAETKSNQDNSASLVYFACNNMFAK